MHSFSRRHFLSIAAQIAAGMVLFDPLESLALQSKTRPLVFYHTHTHESLVIDITRPNPAKRIKKKLNNFLRDFRTGEVHPIDPDLIDILSRIQKKSGSKGAFEVISGYRSPATNKSLRSTSNGVAKKSLHMKGQAIDVRLTDLKSDKLRDVAWSIKKGGVGYYAQSDFVHIDTGRVRCW
jgi:uncharacterized protein YcbK (DUF882 family)